MVTVLLWPYLPGSAERLLGALGAPELSLAGGRARRRARSSACSALDSLFPKDLPAARRVIDSHTHLDLCEPPERRARRGGRRGGRDAHADGRHRRRLLPRGARRGRGLPAGVRGDRAPPERGARASTTPTSPSCARWPRTSAAWRSARRGLDFYRDGAPRADQQRAFAAQIALARETGKPLVIHSRAADARDARAARRRSRTA